MADIKKLGDMLIEAGLIDDFQLQSALSHQRNWGGKLGNIIIEMEFVREEDLARIIAEKLKIPYINLFDPLIPEEVVKLVKADVAKKYHVMPAKKDKSTLVLAMTDPLDIEAMDEIRFITGLTIKPVLAMKSEIGDAISKYYDGQEVLSRKSASPFPQRGHSSGGKMEIIYGSEMGMQKEGGGGAGSGSSSSSSILSKEENVQQTISDNKIRIEALITVLIEKGLITRDELVSMIYQKKMGL